MNHLIVCSFNKRKVGISIEEVVLLKKNCIRLLLIFCEVADSLNITVLKVLFLELSHDYIFFS
jgi:hypothetical protein